MSRRPLRRGRQLLPRALRSAGERREYLVAFGLVGFLQAAITVSLGVAALQTYRMWRRQVVYVPGELGRVIPVLLLLGAVIAGLAALRTFGRIRAVRRIPFDPGPRE